MTDALQGLSAFLRAQANVALGALNSESAECLRSWANAVDELQAARATPADTCKPGGCSAIGCEGGHYCFDANGVARPTGDPLALARAIFTNVESRATPADHSVPVAIPEGWKLVPLEPTETMVVDGFESWPAQFFSSPEEWEAFEAMSGCQKAAHKARLCYRAMLAAAPQAPQKDAESVRDAWISIDERLPEIIEMYPGSGTGNSDPVLVYLDDENDEGKQIAVWRCFRGGQGDTTTIHWDWKSPKVTHWQPLPAPPQTPIGEQP